jgi:hypothetical protein
MISYLITVCDEDLELQKLINSIVLSEDDELIILYDSTKVTPEVMDVVLHFSTSLPNVKYFGEPFNGDFAYFKNVGNSKCSKEWIFQVDADEHLTQDLAENVRDIITSNPPELELVHIPRINTVQGITLDHVKRWNWNISSDDSIQNCEFFNTYTDFYFLLKNLDLILHESNSNGEISVIYKEPIINFPDYQGRLYRNKPHIMWEGKVHERIVGTSVISRLPLQKIYCLVHPKDIIRQERQNNLYNSL